MAVRDADKADLLRRATDRARNKDLCPAGSHSLTVFCARASIIMPSLKSKTEHWLLFYTNSRPTFQRAENFWNLRDTSKIFSPLTNVCVNTGQMH
jgi:hypothetical protein